MKNTYIPIVFSSDDNYAQHLGVAITSLFKNKYKDTKYKIYVIDGGISEENKKKLQKTVKPHNTLINYLYINQDILEGLYVNHYISIASYYRLFIPDIIIEEKIIYLDCDIIIRKDLNDLFNINLEDKAIGGARDMSDEQMESLRPEIKKMYINTGVIIIDSKNWKKFEITKKAINFAKKYPEKMEFLDQDAINYTCQNFIKEISNNYNFRVGHLFDRKKIIKNAHIIHYTGQIKPWHFLYCGPFKSLYKKYLKKTLWKSYKYPDKNLKNIIKKLADFLKNIVIYILPDKSIKKIIKIKNKINFFKKNG